MRRELDLARELSVTHQHVSRIELGDATPSLEMFLKVNRKLGVSTDYLLTRTIAGTTRRSWCDPRGA